MRDHIDEEKIKYFDYIVDKPVDKIGTTYLGKEIKAPETLLPEGVAYYPVDYKQLTGNTLIYDFNQKQFPDIKADIVIIVGVWGYVDHQRWLIEQAVGAVKPGGQLSISLNYLKSHTNAFDFIIQYRDMLQCADYALRDENYGVFRFEKRGLT